jgi:hypothetical protein
MLSCAIFFQALQTRQQAPSAGSGSLRKMTLPITSLGREGFDDETLFIMAMLSDDTSQSHKMPLHIKNMKQNSAPKPKL